MARLEDAQRSLDELTAQLADADDRNAKLEEARDARYAEIDAELARLAEQRGPVAAAVPDRPDWRSTTGSVPPRTASAPPPCAPASAAAACSPSTTPSSAMIRAAAEDEVLRCEECQRILVRTEESGLCEPDRAPVLIEADGGSRGNPGPAAYGAVLKDAETGEVIAEDGTTIGVASNNVAEYRGLIAGLTTGRRPRPGRRDRGPDGLQARRGADVGQLEDQAPRHEAAGARGQPAGAVRDDVHLGAARAEQARRPAGQRGARRQAATASPSPSASEDVPPTEADATRPSTSRAELARLAPAGPDDADPGAARRDRAHHARSGSPAGSTSANPGLSDEGRDQIRATADWLAPLAERVDAVVASPVRRARESGEHPRRAARGRARGGARASRRWSSAPGTG